VVNENPINKERNRSAELLAKYSDVLLRGANKEVYMLVVFYVCGFPLWVRFHGCVWVCVCVCVCVGGCVVM
jgi:hypothetical protein